MLDRTGPSFDPGPPGVINLSLTAGARLLVLSNTLSSCTDRFPFFSWFQSSISWSQSLITPGAVILFWLFMKDVASMSLNCLVSICDLDTSIQILSPLLRLISRWYQHTDPISMTPWLIRWWVMRLSAITHYRPWLKCFCYSSQLVTLRISKLFHKTKRKGTDHT